MKLGGRAVKFSFLLEAILFTLKRVQVTTNTGSWDSWWEQNVKVLQDAPFPYLSFKSSAPIQFSDSVPFNKVLLAA